MKAVVYTLKCPITDEIKYVGLTTKPLSKRLACHVSRPAPKNSKWINNLRANGLKPTIEVLEEVEGDKAHLLFTEKYWMNQLNTWGFKLNNHYSLIKSEPRKKYELKFKVSHELYEAIEFSANLNMRTIIEEVQFQLAKIYKIKL